MKMEDPRLARIFPKPSVVAYKKEKNLKDLLVRAKINSKRKSKRKTNGYIRCGRNMFNMCATCVLIPESGIKTHKCHKTNTIYKINPTVTCTTTNVIYRITCKKPKCQEFVYIGQTKNCFGDRFNTKGMYHKNN